MRLGGLSDDLNGCNSAKEKAREKSEILSPLASYL
jgi:hypothetical protein